LTLCLPAHRTTLLYSSRHRALQQLEVLEQPSLASLSFALAPRGVVRPKQPSAIATRIQGDVHHVATTDNVQGCSEARGRGHRQGVVAEEHHYGVLLGDGGARGAGGEFYVASAPPPRFNPPNNPTRRCVHHAAGAALGSSWDERCCLSRRSCRLALCGRPQG